MFWLCCTHYIAPRSFASSLIATSIISPSSIHCSLIYISFNCSFHNEIWSWMTDDRLVFCSICYMNYDYCRLKMAHINHHYMLVLKWMMIKSIEKNIWVFIELYIYNYIYNDCWWRKKDNRSKTYSIHPSIHPSIHRSIYLI